MPAVPTRPTGPYTAIVTNPAAHPPARFPVWVRMPRRAAVVDAALAGLYAAVFLGSTLLVMGRKTLYLPWLGGAGPGSLTIDLRLELLSRASIALLVVCAVALAWRRSRPAASFLVVWRPLLGVRDGTRRGALRPGRIPRVSDQPS